MLKRYGLPVVLGVGFIALGFLVIVIAWHGAASKDFTQGQIPYLLSGGFAGLGFIIVGVGLFLFEASRRAQTQVVQRLSAIEQAFAGNGAGSGASNGSSLPARGVLVVVGGASFHRPDCRLVAGKEGLDYMVRESAAEEGLKACRICRPEG